ncbi:MAG: hypothetical protein AAB484_02685 [Patescibacteria group bacterium]
MRTIEELRQLGNPKIVEEAYGDATRNIGMSDRLIIESDGKLPQSLENHHVIIYARELFQLLESMKGSECRR